MAGEATEKAERKTRSREKPPFLAVVTLVAAVLGGGLARWPDARAAHEDAVAPTPEARETLEAARSLLHGDGFTVPSVAGRRPARAPAGAIVPVAASIAVFKDAPASPLKANAILSTGALVLAAAAGIAAAGWWAGASAAMLLAALPSQIDATRVISPIPLATCLLAASALTAVLALRGSKGSLGGMLAAGALAGLGYSVHPVLALVACALVGAALLRPAPAAALGALLGVALGVTPLALQRAMSYGSPLISSERAAEPMAFQGAPGSTLADWTGLELATPGPPLPEAKSFLFAEGHFERIVIGVVALLALASLLRGPGPRSLLLIALGSLVATAGLSAAASASGTVGVPATATLAVLFASVALLAGLGISSLGRLGPFGSLLALGALGVTIALEHRDLLRAVRSSPGLFTEREAEGASGRPASRVFVDSSIDEVRAAEKAPSALPEPEASPRTAEPPAAPTPPAPKPPVPATAKDLATARSLLAGEGGATKPSVDLEGTTLTLTLRLESANLTADSAVPDAVRLSLKIAEALPRLEVFRVRVTSMDGKLLSSTLVSAERARAFAPKLDDPFESRRMREWWPAMEAR